MTRKKAVIKKTGRRHSIAFKEEAIALADTVGVREAAHQLGLHESQLYDWCRKARERLNKSQTERDKETEIARLKRQVAEQAEELAIIKKAATYFAKSLK